MWPRVGAGEWEVQERGLPHERIAFLSAPNTGSYAKKPCGSRRTETAKVQLYFQIQNPALTWAGPVASRNFPYTPLGAPSLLSCIGEQVCV